MITVASVPAGHPYVAAVVDPNSVVLLPDPTPPGVTEPDRWWPPRLLDPAYLSTQLGSFDLLHVHFGFDATPPETLAEVAALLDRSGIPLIVTVHDLENPHFLDQTEHHRRLGVLLAAASAVVTLTEGAAREIEHRWRKNSVVLPHPNVVPLEEIGAPRVHREPVVAIHAKGLRANIDPWPVLDALMAPPLTGRHLRLDLDESALASARADEVSDQRLSAYRAAGVDVRVHPRFSDAELSGYLGDIDVLVLPYRFGTHSGWVEACRDAGVRAVVPDCGHLHEQHLFPVYRYDRAGLDTAGLVRAVEVAIDQASQPPSISGAVLREHREHQRNWVRRQMTQVYSRSLAREVVA
ncbi:glycosyltransferase [Mycolicibacterium mengxianglii]|uniref:glycosyltransferase n=1 Tax=Mycolicibacterium mengxianglii TaxID=2736649 RepID=UPI0018D1A808|nr:glycosyltransferase [Mycolicibacterium mengxianglii]